MTSEDVFIGGGSNSGSYNKANLPNIKGEYTNSWNVINTDATYRINGALRINRDSSFRNINEGTDVAENDEYNGWLFNASWYNPTYNDLNRVNPDYYNVEWWIKYK